MCLNNTSRNSQAKTTATYIQSIKCLKNTLTFISRDPITLTNNFYPQESLHSLICGPVYTIYIDVNLGIGWTVISFIFYNMGKNPLQLHIVSINDRYILLNICLKRSPA